MKQFAVAAAAAILAVAASAAGWAAAQNPLPTAGASFKDCADCPEMIVVPAGSYTMGSPVTEEFRDMREGPQHRVVIPRAFAVGKYEVTRAEYGRFVADTHRPDPASCFEIAAPDGKRVEKAGLNWHNPGYPQGEREPVACVSWEDAQAYAQWLSAKTGKAYRLLSEAEWEYTARAGSQAARYGSDDPAQMCRYISGGEQDYTGAFPGDTDVNMSCHDGYAHTSPVGAFPPNAFGLYDMLGNLLEWTADCSNPTYDGAPADGSAWTSGDCTKRAIRSGSWTNGPRSLRAAYRDGQAPGYRAGRVGFRIARPN